MPKPDSPQWIARLPIKASSGCARANDSGGAPTMNDSVAASAPTVPPDTGASIIDAPASAIRADTDLATAWSSVVQSAASVERVRLRHTDAERSVGC